MLEGADGSPRWSASEGGTVMIARGEEGVPRLRVQEHFGLWYGITSSNAWQPRIRSTSSDTLNSSLVVLFPASRNKREVHFHFCPAMSVTIERSLKSEKTFQSCTHSRPRPHIDDLLRHVRQVPPYGVDICQLHFLNF